MALVCAVFGICVVGALKTATACAASAATSTGSCKLFCHRQLDSHGLRATMSQKTNLRMPHVMLLEESSESGVQARWAVVRK